MSKDCQGERRRGEELCDSQVENINGLNVNKSHWVESEQIIKWCM